MKRLKRELNRILPLLLLSMFLLCGCGTKDSRTVVQFASWGSKTETDIMKSVLVDFEKQNPDIKVDFMHIPQNYFQKIHLLLASNTAPDVIFINNLYLPVYVKHLEKLSASCQDFYPQALEALSFDGNLYAIPRDVSNLVIFYNKDLFDKKSLPYPSKNWDMRTFLETARKLTDANSFGISFEEEPMFYLPFLMSNGGGILPDEINKPESQKALMFYADLRKKYHVAPLKFESASATMGQMFLQERIAMYISGRWMVPKLREQAGFDWDIAEFPSGSSGSIVPLDASGWAITKSSVHKNEAEKLVQYLSSKKSIEHFAQSGLIVPARKDAAHILFDGQKPYNAQVFTDIIQSSKPTPVNIDYRVITDNLKQKTEKIFN